MLPADWVERLFARLAARYGSAWIAKWNGIDMPAVKADWAQTLSGFTADDIAYALQIVDADFPPNAAQFRELCRRAPRSESALMLGAPTGPKEAAPGVLAHVRQVMATTPRDPRAWAYTLKRREEDDGERLTQFQRSAWREALKVPAAEAP